SIYVAPAAQRRGIGRALLERLIAEAELGGFRQMIAVIGDSANAGSVELHRAAGFRLVGTFNNVGFKFGRWLDTVLMQRPLGGGATTAP
ncbi:MAG TPA: GNAT family N-acetyltransferase, partial [Xanthobacteraceae bacterium]